MSFTNKFNFVIYFFWYCVVDEYDVQIWSAFYYKEIIVDVSREPYDTGKFQSREYMNLYGSNYDYVGNSLETVQIYLGVSW